MDKEGKAFFSPTITVNISTKNIKTKVYPNPLQSNSWLSINTANADKIHLVICDITGKICWEQNENIIAGNNLIALPYESLLQGMYLLRIKGKALDESVVIRK